MRKSALRPGRSNPGAPSNSKAILTIVAADDIQSFPTRDGGGVRMLGNIVMKPGAKMEQLYTTKSKQVKKYETEGEEDAQSIKQMLEGSHPGNDLQVREFMSNWNGVPAIVIVDFCEDKPMDVYGTPCAPMNLKPSLEDNNDGSNTNFTFEQYAKSGYLPGSYTGTTSFAEPFQLAAQDVTVAADDATRQYNMAASEVVDTDVTFEEVTADNDTIITLVGGGGSEPATLSNGVNTGTAAPAVILKDGTDWVALSGAIIDLKVVNDGATTYLIEQSRR